MKTPELIFPNCSYFVFLDARGELAGQMAEFSSRQGCRTYHCRNADELIRTVKVMSRCLGIFIYNKGISPAELKSVEGYLDPLNLPRLIIEVGEADTAGALDGFVAKLVPGRLDEFVLHCARQAFPTFFEGLGEWDTVGKLNVVFDRQVIHSTVDGDVIGFCNLKLRLEKALGVFKDRNEGRILNDALEATNQFLGLISQNLAQINISPKIGLPTIFDLTKIPEVQTLVFFPSVRVSDEMGLFSLALGYTHLEGAELFDLTGIEPLSGSSEIEML